MIPPSSAPSGIEPHEITRKLAMTRPSRWFGTIRWRIEPKTTLNAPPTVVATARISADQDRLRDEDPDEVGHEQRGDAGDEQVGPAEDPLEPAGERASRRPSRPRSTVISRPNPTPSRPSGPGATT